MNTELLSGLITSKTRIRVLMRLFLNPERHAYLRELAGEFSVSPSQVKEELSQLSEAGLLQHRKEGRQIHYRANTQHPLFPELQGMVKKALGMDRILESIVERLGDLELAFLLDDYAEGKDTGIIDLGLVGNVDYENLADLVRKTEKYVDRKIRTLVLNQAEYRKLHGVLQGRPMLIVWRRGADNAVAQRSTGKASDTKRSGGAAV